ncbi:hypothetical protein OIDMADRAFT_47225 [Oidiodendron maius Zn]|uniref:Uncharacterized protein n=1 Tax=Oidiodendron maius (strain Zn) TaxID=913774 RepID=A0A0C3HGI3_OIDMZ|nr:hypothetical protein OIDMADRAFT_47225 [Oidiodendron maius Zn]
MATALNNVLHGNDFENDISKRDVSKMIDKILEERKAIVGPGGYMDRAVPGRITRGLKMMWERSTKFDFDGSMAEWNLGRKVKEMKKLGIGIDDAVVDNAIEEGEVATQDGDDSDEGAPKRKRAKFETDYWEHADRAAASTQANWRGSANKTCPTTNSNFSTLKDWTDPNPAGHAQNLDANRVHKDSAKFSVNTSSYPGAPHPSYRPPYGGIVPSNQHPYAIPSGNSPLSPPPGPSINLQNLQLARKVSRDSTRSSQALPSSIRSLMLIKPPSTGGVEENSIEKGIHQMLNQGQTSTRSLTSLDSIDKKGVIP